MLEINFIIKNTLNWQVGATGERQLPRVKLNFKAAVLPAQVGNTALSES